MQPVKAEAEEGREEGAPERKPAAQRNGLPGVFEAAGGDKDPSDKEKATAEQGKDSADAPAMPEKPAGEAPQSEGAADGAKMEVDTEPKEDKGDGMDVDKEDPPKE